MKVTGRVGIASASTGIKMPLSSNHNDPLLALLQAALPADCIVADRVSMKPYECDGLSGYRQMPRVVVLPKTVEHVQKVMRICRQTGTPVVPRGAGTSLSGGAMPH